MGPCTKTASWASVVTEVSLPQSAHTDNKIAMTLETEKQMLFEHIQACTFKDKEIIIRRGRVIQCAGM